MNQDKDKNQGRSEKEKTPGRKDTAVEKEFKSVNEPADKTIKEKNENEAGKEKVERMERGNGFMSSDTAGKSGGEKSEKTGPGNEFKSGINREDRERGLAKFVYHGPSSGVTLKYCNEDIELVFSDGKIYMLPERSLHVKKMIARGFLQKV